MKDRESKGRRVEGTKGAERAGMVEKAGKAEDAKRAWVIRETW